MHFSTISWLDYLTRCTYGEANRYQSITSPFLQKKARQFTILQILHILCILQLNQLIWHKMQMFSIYQIISTLQLSGWLLCIIQTSNKVSFA